MMRTNPENEVTAIEPAGATRQPFARGRQKPGTVFVVRFRRADLGEADEVVRTRRFLKDALRRGGLEALDIKAEPDPVVVLSPAAQEEQA